MRTVFFLLLTVLFPLKSGPNNDWDELLDAYNYVSPVEKVYLHTDRAMFSPGETLWFSGYVVLGQDHRLSEASKVLHIELLGGNGQTINAQTRKISKGKAMGSVKIPEDLVTGSYQLRAYTNYMRNFGQGFFFTRTIEVVATNDTTPAVINSIRNHIDLQFFPEGGHAVNGIRGLVAFKAIGVDGLDRKVSGKVIDASGNLVATLKTLDRGAGYMTWRPQNGERYTAILDNGVEYPLPEAKAQGYAMAVNNRDPYEISVEVRASDGLIKNEFYVIGTINNKKVCEGTFDFNGKNTVEFEIPKRGIPSGVMVLTLFDGQNEPWCERALFVNNREELVVTASLSPENPKKRDKVDIDIQVTDTSGKPVITELSMAVTDADQMERAPYSTNILTRLLLESDLKGHIARPASLFKDLQKETLQRLDLVMLTHGWRKIPWPELIKGDFKAHRFDFSNGLTFSGRVMRSPKKPLANIKLNVFAKSGKDFSTFSSTTSPKGRFKIEDLNLSDSVKLSFTALDSKDRPIKPIILLDRDGHAPPTSDFTPPLPHQAIPTENQMYSRFAQTRKAFDSLYPGQKVTRLKEVVVSKKKKTLSSNSRPSVYGVTPDFTLYAKDLKSPISLADFIDQRVPKRTINTIQGQGAPLIVLDGIPVDNLDDLGINTFDIERIEILKNHSANVYGSRGFFGVILLYTKRGPGNNYEINTIPEYTVMGHAPEKKFYSPKYAVDPGEKDIPDYRSTLYWNPSFTTDENGKARLSFYNSDHTDRFQIAIEGISRNGHLGAFLKTIGPLVP